MKCIVTGSGNSVLKFRKELRNEILNYTKCVEEDLPEVLKGVTAVQCKNCTAVFNCETKFIDFNWVNKFRHLYIEVHNSKGKYVKAKGSNRGTWFSTNCMCSSTTNYKVELPSDESIHELHDFDDLELWEMRQ